jgi:two-component system cell cycle response regulator DivK
MVPISSANRPPRILVVEDNPANLRIVQRWMTRQGFEMFSEEDGLAGLHAALSLQPDCVLLDMNLPGLDGWEVAQRLRADPAGKDLFIIALTAHAFEEDMARCLAVGCDRFFSKPANFHQISVLISERFAMRNPS